MRYQAALHTEARRIPKPEIRAKVSAVASVNARPLRNTLTQPTEARHDRHQQEKEKERSERFALDRIDAPLKKSIDSGLISLGKLLGVVSISGKIRFGHVGVLLWFKNTLYRLRTARPTALQHQPLKITLGRL